MTQQQSDNYLINGKTPLRKTTQFYQNDKVKKENFSEVWGVETHSRRRKLILEKHQQVKELLIPSKPYSIIIAIFLVPLGLLAAYLAKDSSWIVFMLTCYIVGGTINHSCHVLIHDFTHYAGCHSPFVNKLMAIFSNIPIAIPTAISFGKYHSDHHNFLNQDGKDPDLPLLIQARNIKTVTGKFMFVIVLSLVYSLRPVFAYKSKVITWQYINIIFILITDLLIYHFWGINALFYLILASFFAIGPHPAAMHILAEHYQFVKGMQTYDYFGIWNFFNLNLGYHIQHHDFPNCPWYNLPKVRAAAPQFYNYLPHHTSYVKVGLKFIFDNNFNLFNRTHRVNKKNN